MTITSNVISSVTSNVISNVTRQFKPSDLTGGAAWFESSDTSSDNIQQNAGSVSGWTDKLGNGNVIQLAGSNQPKTGISTLNGKNLIDFDGNEDFLSGGNILDIASEHTIFAVVNSNGVGAVNRYVLSHITFGVGGYALGRLSNLNHRVSYEALTPSGHGFTPAVSTSGEVYSTIFRSDFSAESFVNGVSKKTETYNQLPKSAPSANFNIGRWQSGLHWGGSIGEIIIYNRALSTYELSLVHTYLKTKWGIS